MGGARFTLINAGPSPYGRKVAIALREKGLDYDMVYDLPWGEALHTRRHSPLEQLPILLPPDGPAVYDSSYILLWLETRHPTPALLPTDIDERLEAQRRQMIGERLMEIAQGLIFEMHRPDPSPAWIERQQRKIASGLAELERSYAGGLRDPAAIDLGDIAVATTLLLWEHVVRVGLSPDIAAFRWRDSHPALARAVVAIEDRPSFAATMPQPMEVDVSATVR